MAKASLRWLPPRRARCCRPPSSLPTVSAGTPAAPAALDSLPTARGCGRGFQLARPPCQHLSHLWLLTINVRPLPLHRLSLAIVSSFVVLLLLDIFVNEHTLGVDVMVLLLEQCSAALLPWP